MENSKFRKMIYLITGALSSLVGLALILISYFLGAKWLEVWNHVCNIGGAIFLFAGICSLYLGIKKEENKLTIKQMTLIALLSSITVILYYFVKFNLPFFPPWLDIQVSEIPALIAGFAYGPYAGCLVIFIRFIIKLPATMTAGVGELADLILSCALVLTSSIIYHRNKTIKGALVGTSIGVGVSTILSIFVNWLILIPAYINIAGFKMEQLVGMMSYIPFYEVTVDNFMLTYVLIGVIPFNLFRYILVAALTFVLYKKTHKLLIRLAN